MCGRMVDIQSATAKIRREEKRKKKETTGQKYNGLPYSTGLAIKIGTNGEVEEEIPPGNQLNPDHLEHGCV